MYADANDHQPWTRQDLEDLKVCIDSGLTVAQTATALSREGSIETATRPMPRRQGLILTRVAGPATCVLHRPRMKLRLGNLAPPTSEAFFVSDTPPTALKASYNVLTVGARGLPSHDSLAPQWVPTGQQPPGSCRAVAISAQAPSRRASAGERNDDREWPPVNVARSSHPSDDAQHSSVA
jgi:hypothetical protein